MGETDDEIILTEALENDIDESDVYSEACYSVTCEELVDLMKRQDILVAINERFTNVCGLVKALKSSATQGLLGVHSDLEGRVKLFGENFIETRPPKTFLKLVWEALRDPILRILSVCAIISFILGMIIDNIKTGWIEGFAILVAVAICSLVAALNDWQKEKQFRQLQNKIDDEQVIDVIRNGEVIKMQTTKLVVGDICLLNYGNLIPADGILLQGNDLKVDESSLTGESGLVKKNLNNPALFSGTHVMEGSGKYIITAVGVNSKSGMIMVLLGAVGKTTEAYVNHEEVKIVKKENQSQEKEKSILQSKLTKLAVMIGWIGVAAGVITSFVIILRFCIQTYAVEKKSWDKKHLIDFLHAIIVGITIMVVAIPEGLPLAVTISLTYSIKKMLLDNNLVRHLTACETMGNATVICSDKTGTLTTNRMTVVESYMQGLYFKGTPNLSTLKKDFVELFCQSISINSNYGSQIKPSETAKGLASQLGNKTECALLGFVLNLGENYQTYRDEVPQEKFVRVYTFNSLRKSMSTVIKKPDGGYRLFSKGASEILLQKCSKIVNNVGSVEEFNESQRENINDTVIKKMASNGLRTILVTYRDFSPEETPNWEDESSVLSNLTCMAIVGIEDPVRAEVPYAIKQCQNAGITIRMVTGDNINTARSIALKCGILDINSEFLVIEGSEFNLRIRDDKGKIQQELIDNIWPQIRVLARSSPEDKYNLVKGIIDSRLTKAREIVAVTGDGTNDGPALKKADVGFAMGIQGTEVAKEASDIILTDDNFTSIVKAVMWGRNVYDGISKFIQFQCTVNFAAIWISIIGSIVLSVSPLSAMQLLWINLIMDSFASLALATEHPSDSLLERKPYGRTKSLISHSMLRFILGHGFYQLIIILILTFYGHTLFDIPYGFTNPREPSQHLTILFNAFVMMQIFNEVNARMVHGERNVFKNIFSNKLFSLIVFGTFIVQILLIELGGRALSVMPLSIDQWLWCIFLGFSELLWGQLIISLPKYKNRI